MGPELLAAKVRCTKTYETEEVFISKYCRPPETCFEIGRKVGGGKFKFFKHA